MRMTNRERYLKYKDRVKKWALDNPEKHSAIQARYRRNKGQMTRKAWAESIVGINNPHFTGRASRTNNETWRKLALEIQFRDKFECQFCGRKKGQGMRLNVHHIIPYDISQNDDPKNLITLCQLCHLRTHQILRKEGKRLFA